MNKPQKIALLYISALAIFLYGYSIARFHIPPYQFMEAQVQNFQSFAAGDDLEKESTIIQKLKNDAGITPERFIYQLEPGFFEGHDALDTANLNSRRDLPQSFTHPDHLGGYRVIVGALDFEESLWGALLIDSTGAVAHQWNLSTDHLPDNKSPDFQKNLYGVHVFPDGSIIFVMHEAGGGIVKVDACSNEVWNLPGQYHHAISPDDQGNIWSFAGEQVTFDQDMIKVSFHTGEILQTIDMSEVRSRNKGTNFWNLQSVALGLYTLASQKKGMEEIGNMTHGNDIEPLPSSLADKFPAFEVDDLLVSYATTNLVFILDPDTLEVKWWRVGIADTQHDPDWEPDGTIAIYDNQMRDQAEFSSIKAVDPATHVQNYLFDGKENGFKSSINGRHQLTEFGTRLITSATQGWAFEIDEDGDTVFSYLNTYSGDKHTTLHLSEAFRFPETYFEGKPWLKCSGEE